jgi:PadR family transcriptional regulator PadR
MDTQFKKGVLELIVLCLIDKKDYYGYELVSMVSKVIDINEGTLYPLLKRLTNEKYCETYLVESSEGPPRKYYKITSLGKNRKDDLVRTWNEFNNSVNNFVEESENND